MEIDELNGCCSVGELSDHYTTPYTSKKQYKEAFAEFVANYLESGSDEYPRYYIATTRSEAQRTAELVLTALGFKSKAIFGRHLDSNGKPFKYLKFWHRSGLPRGVLTMAKQIAKERSTW